MDNLSLSTRLKRHFSGEKIYLVVTEVVTGHDLLTETKENVCIRMGLNSYSDTNTAAICFFRDTNTVVVVVVTSHENREFSTLSYLSFFRT